MSTNEGLCLIGGAGNAGIIRESMRAFDEFPPVLRRYVTDHPVRVCVLCLDDELRAGAPIPTAIEMFEHELRNAGLPTWDLDDLRRLLARYPTRCISRREGVWHPGLLSTERVPRLQDYGRIREGMARGRRLQEVREELDRRWSVSEQLWKPITRLPDPGYFPQLGRVGPTWDRQTANEAQELRRLRLDKWGRE